MPPTEVDVVPLQRNDFAQPEARVAPQEDDEVGQVAIGFLCTELTKVMIRMTVTESAPFRCRQGAKQRMES